MDSRKTHIHGRWPVATGTVGLAVLLAAVVSVAYAPALQGDFLFDDLSEIVANPAIRMLWPPTRSMFTGGELPHRPLPYLTFAVNHALGGLEPFGYHVFNLLVHLCNGWLLWWLVARTLTRRRAGRLAAEPPADPHAIATIAAALLNAGRDAEAAAVCRQGRAAARLDAAGDWRDPVARRLDIYLGMALDREGDPAGRRLLAEAVRVDPDSLLAREQLARALVRDEPRQAAELYRQIVPIKPRDPQLRYDLGCALAAFAPAEAEQAFRAAIRLEPDNADAHNNLAGLLFAAGRLDEAIAAYRACLGIRPDHPLAGTNLAAAEAARAGAGD